MHEMMIRADAKAQGMTTAQTVRVSAPWSSFRTRVVGVAPGTEATSVVPTVLCRYADGTQAVRTVASFTKRENRGKGRIHNPIVDNAQAARTRRTHTINAAELPAIGNIE